VSTESKPLRFTAPVRYFHPERAAGLAVVDVPADFEVVEIG
jgi:hypothetical protein